MGKRNKQITKYDLSSFDYKKLKEMDNKELESLAISIREEIIKACAKNGGHLGSNLGVVEATIALHKAFNFPTDKIIFDVGHQSYTHKILSGRSLDNLRQKDGIDGFQKIDESVYDAYEAGHSSTSISAAMGLALARDLKGEDYEVIAFIGDSSISNGLAFEALNHLSEFNHKVIVVLNDNDMSIAKPVGGMHKMLEGIRVSGSYSKTKIKLSKLNNTKVGKFIYRVLRKIKNIFKHIFLRENMFENLGLYYIGVVDGYDYKGLDKAFKKAKKASVSSIIHITTTKGKGYAPAEADKDGFWHGVAPFDIATGKPLKEAPKDVATWSKVYARLLEIIMKTDDKAIIINPATTIGSYLKRVMNDNKARAYDVGISEEHATILANSLSVGGMKPYLSIYSSFFQRAYDEVAHDIARMDGNVTILLDRAGLVGHDGETHQGVYDVAMLYSIPGIAIAMARNQNDAARLMKFSMDYNHPLVIRYPNTTTHYDKLTSLPVDSIEYGKWEILKKSDSGISLISVGPKVDEFLDLDINLIYPLFLNPIDKDCLKEVLDSKLIIIHDAYSTEEGFASKVKLALYDLGYKGKIVVRAISNDYIRAASISEQEAWQSVDTNSIKKIIEKEK